MNDSAFEAAVYLTGVVACGKAAAYIWYGFVFWAFGDTYEDEIMWMFEPDEPSKDRLKRNAAILLFFIVPGAIIWIRLMMIFLPLIERIW